MFTHAGNGSYTGTYADGKKHGRGTFTWADGSAYDGEWADDLMHGTGIVHADLSFSLLGCLQIDPQVIQLQSGWMCFLV